MFREDTNMEIQQYVLGSATRLCGSFGSQSVVETSNICSIRVEFKAH